MYSYSTSSIHTILLHIVGDFAFILHAEIRFSALFIMHKFCLGMLNFAVSFVLAHNIYEHLHRQIKRRSANEQIIYIYEPH